jgi:drug/metabolite transporter (DMT)-like permease
MQASLSIIAAMCIWSTWGPLIRWMALPPAVVLFYTAAIASFTVPAFLVLRGELDLSGVSRARGTFALLAFCFIVNNLTYFFALAHTTVANSVFTHYTAPIFVALLSPLLLSERIQRVTLLSLPIAAIGMTIVALSGGGLRTGGSHLPGIAAGTASGVAYAFIIIYSRKLSRINMHRQAVALMPWLTAAAMLPAAFLSEYHLGPRTAALLLVSGIFHSTVAPLLYYYALRTVVAQHAAILGYMEPLAAIPMAWVLLSERPAAGAFFGGALILLSGYLVIRKRSLSG